MRAGRARRFLAAGAAAGAFASSAYAAGPAWATDEPVPAPAATVAGPQHSGLSEAALEEAVARDLGMTPAEFAAAGELGTQAGQVAARLRNVPGYSGTRLEDGQIVVSGSGAELLGEVATLSGSVPHLAVEGPAQLREAEAPEAFDEKPQGTEVAVSTEQLFQAYLREVGASGLQAVVSSGGKFVIRTGAVNSSELVPDPAGGQTVVDGAEDATPAGGSGKKSPAEFVSRYANVELDGGGPLAPEADVPGGVGYLADTGWICSTGFSAFDPAGLPAVLTAGHCASDGAAATAELESQFNRIGFLGRFGFSQFGGPGNSRVLDPNTATGSDQTAQTDPGNVGTDIAVVESLGPDVEPLPAASTWGDPSQPEPDVKIIGTVEPVAGMAVCRSGRTSAWSCGTIDAVGIFLVGGPAITSDPTDVRAFNGFLSYDVQSSGGDSGGPYVSGNYAVGTHAAGEPAPGPGQPPLPNQAVAATLSGSLAVLPGYQLELFLNKPVVASPATGTLYEPGQVISGNVPAAPASAVAAGSEVRITIQGQEPFEVPVGSDGSWSFVAPDSTQALRFTAETINGYSASGTSSFEFAPVAQADQESGRPVQQEPSSVGQDPAGPAPSSTPTPAPAPGNVVVNPPVSAPRAGPAATGGGVDGRGNSALAYTGPSALAPAAGAAAAAIVVGGLLMVLVRVRRKRTTTK